MGGAAKRPRRQLKPQKPQDFSPARRGRPKHHLFSVGSLVEVQTDEEDFKGVFFLATVIPSSPLSKNKSSKKNFKKFYVEYHNLLAHENGSECLREHVDASFVRPAPPPQEDVKGFEINDSVDAFYKDGWWTGVVTRVLEGGRFIVTFQYPPDELEFGLADLRVHWDWCDGSWVRPEKQSIAALMFDVGRKVEVSLDLEDSQDAWFPATIEEVLGNGSYFVEFSSSKIGNEAQFLKVTVDSHHIRPCPPLLKDKNFILLEKVDSFFNFGWWNGVITRVLEDCRYIVFFQQMKKEKEFHQSELRPHMEWRDGKWFTASSSQDGSTPSSDNEKLSCLACENASDSTAAVPICNLEDGKNSNWCTPCVLNLNENQIEPLIPTYEKSSDSTKSLAKRKQHSSDTCNALSQPLKKLKEGSVIGTSQGVTTDRSSKELLHSSPSSVSVINISSSAIQPAAGEQSSDNHSWRKTIQRKPRKVGDKGFSTSRTSKKSRTATLQLGNREPDVEGKELDTIENTAKDVQNDPAEKGTEIPIIIGLPCTEIGSPEYGKSRGKRGHRSNSKEIMKLVTDVKQHSNDLAIENMKNGKRSETGEFSQTKKRGRPRKVLIDSPQSLVTGTQIGNVTSEEFTRKDGDLHRTLALVVTGMDDSLPNSDLAFNGPNDESDPKNRIGRLKKRTSAKMQIDKVAKESIRLRKNPSSKRGRRWMIIDSLDASRGTTTESKCTVDTIKKIVTEGPCNEFDDEPLSKWIEGIQTPTVVDSRMSPVSNVEQCLEICEKKKDTVVLMDDSEKQNNSDLQPSAFDDTCAIVPSEQQNLPFMKNNILWNTIESMEIFRRMPQRPHFQPLFHFKESSREGLAIGYMVTFYSVVEKLTSLQLVDPKSVTDDILETLGDLEKYGFDVRVVQDRVTELLAVKNKQEKLVEEVSGLNSQIVNHHLGRGKIVEEISEIKRQIVNLQEKLSLAVSAQLEEDSEIASLQCKQQKIEESIKIVEREFEDLASASL